ncbi:DedA family protein [Nemorincola caseinilytica]|uniref:DedA family protein n=1 Tax=Nemorincola caseinilytica TaxID=2054315 RepID=A0ABP8NF68_9BACT
MHDIIELLKTLLADPDKLMAFIRDNGGLYIVMAIIFAETGLFVGFFLPGDSLLFVAGIILATTTPAPFSTDLLNLPYWLTLISLAAIVGNMVGYWLGRRSGHMWFERKESWIFKRKHLVQAHDFYEKKGSLAIIMGRFLPIVRTFAPLIAGIVNMSYKKFMSYSIIGALAWVISMTMAGYLLGSNEFVKHHLEKIVILIIIVTTAPVIFKMFFGKKKEEVKAS